MAENATTTIEEICLDNFSVSDVNAFISRALKLDHEKTIRLSEIIHRKTNGNPFFVVQFLTTLRDMGIVDYSLGTMEWSWDEHRVKDLFVTDNVLQEILRVRIRNLSPMGRFLSQVAACFGTNFTQDLLFTGAQAIQKDCEDMMSFELCEAQMKEGINNLVAEGIFEHCWSEDDSSCSDLRFAHDQILEVAAADLLPWETAWQWKAVLARAMLWSKHANDPKWFYVIADLTNEGHSQLVLLENMEIVDMVIDINCRAGVKAMESGAYTAAIQYTDVALSLLGDCGKDTQSTIDLHTLAAHSGYCSGNFRSMQTHLDAILKDQLDIPFSAKLPAYVTLVLSHIAQTEWNQAINVGLEILRQLGFKLSQNVTALRILYELMRTNALIHSRSFDDLCDLPLLHDDMAIYTERIFDALATATYTMKSDFFPLLTLLHIQMCIQRGVGTYSPVAFATYGIIVGAKLGKLGEGYKMGEVAKHLLSRLPNKASTSRTIFLIHQFLSHWVKPAFQGIKISYEGYIVGLQIGDVESALYNRMSAALFSWACGQKLDVVEQEARKVCTESYEYQQRNVRSVMEPYWQQVLNLMGHSVDPLTMVGEAMSEGGVLADPNVQFYEGLNMYALKLQLGYIFGAPIKFMEEYLDKSKLLPELTLGSIQAQRHIFYEGAVAFLLANNYSGRKRRKWKRHGLKIKRKIERWLHEGHVNSIHAIPFYEAELQVIKRNRAKAKKFYEVTIRLSSKNGYQQDRALAHERAGANFMALGDSYWATYHLSSSRDCYLKWGAHAKVKQMQEKYADLCMLDITDRIDTPDNNSSIVTL
jgi:predicted ATPase